VEAISLFKFAIDNYKEIGGGATIFLLSVGWAYHKYIQKQMGDVQKQIKDEQAHDKKQFKKIKEDLRTAITQIHDIEVEVAAKKSKLEELDKGLAKMVLDFHQQTKLITDNAHKLELNERTVGTLKDILNDFTDDVKDFQKKSHSMEMSLAKLLGALSRNFD